MFRRAIKRAMQSTMPTRRAEGVKLLSAAAWVEQKMTRSGRVKDVYRYTFRANIDYGDS